MRTFTTSLALVLATTFATAGAQPQSASALLGYPTFGDPAVVTLVAAGAEPRARVRYALPTDYHERVSMTVAYSMTMTMEGTASPPMVMPTSSRTADVKRTDTSSTGDVVYLLTFTAASSGAASDLAHEMEAQFKSISGTVTMSDRGTNRAVKFDFAQVEPQLGRIMVAPWESLSVPFPEEPIGVGARWDVKQTVSVDAAMLQQKTTYELVAAAGKVVTLKATIEQVGLPQSMANPAMPAGTEAQIKSVNATGTSAITVNLDSVVPTVESSMKGTTAVEISAAGNTMAMTSEAAIKTSIAPVKRND